MMTRWMTVTCGVGMLVGILAACSDSDTTSDTGSGASTGAGASGGATTSGPTSTTSGMGGNGGDAGPTLNGCTRSGATDETGSATAAVPAWSIPHQGCIVVDAGTAVTWTGDFTFHPLSGGETNMADASSPISGNTPANGEVTVTFATAGEYPYYCTNHGSSMQGVIYVE